MATQAKPIVRHALVQGIHHHLARAKQLHAIAEDAAFLTAALLDPTTDHGMKTREVLATVEDLLPKLEAAGLMADYRQPHGGFGLWAS